MSYFLLSSKLKISATLKSTLTLLMIAFFFAIDMAWWLISMAETELTVFFATDIAIQPEPVPISMICEFFVRCKSKT